MADNVPAARVGRAFYQGTGPVRAGQAARTIR
jgi:hypothetical protein